MTEQRRRYHSDIRREQARGTRRAIVAAATELFVERGYAATTIDAVAERAGVGRKTVFTAVGGKPVLLKLAWDWAVAGDDEPVPMADRAVVRRMEASADPAEVVHLWVRMVAGVMDRLSGLAPVVAAAADSDPDVAALQAEVDRQRLVGARAGAAHLAAIGGLRPGLSRARAADACWGLMDPALYRRMVHGRGWSQRAFEEWLESLLAAALLG